MSDFSPVVNQYLKPLIAAYEVAFPDRIISVYVEGSFASGTPVESSDIDLVIVFRESFMDSTERERANSFGDQISGDSPIELDLTILDETGLATTGMTPALKLGSQLLFGQDLRETIPLIPIEDWAIERMHAAYWLMSFVHNRPSQLTIPLTYPDPDDEFFGYARRMLTLRDGRKVPCTRDLIRTTGWAATALLAYRAGQYVPNKKDCAALYGQYFQDGWVNYQEAVYSRCRLEWNYLIPENKEDRAALRDLCRETLGFESYFLIVYKEFVLRELHSGDPEHLGRALWVMDHLPFQDIEILASIASITDAIARIHP